MPHTNRCQRITLTLPASVSLSQLEAAVGELRRLGLDAQTDDSAACGAQQRRRAAAAARKRRQRERKRAARPTQATVTRDTRDMSRVTVATPGPALLVLDQGAERARAGFLWLAGLFQLAGSLVPQGDHRGGKWAHGYELLGSKPEAEREAAASVIVEALKRGVHTSRTCTSQHIADYWEYYGKGELPFGRRSRGTAAMADDYQADRSAMQAQTWLEAVP